MNKIIVSKSALKEKYESLSSEELRILARQNYISLYRTKVITRDYFQELEFAPAGLIEILAELERFILCDSDEEESQLYFQVKENNFLEIQLKINRQREETPEELKKRITEELTELEIARTKKSIARQQDARKELETEITLVD